MSGNGAAAEPLLRLEAVDTYYGQIHILQGLSIRIAPGELVCLLGGNASGKSTTLKTTLGIVKPRRGRVLFRGEDVTGRPTSYRIAQGMAIVPENRRLFAPMTVLENLEMGAYLRGGGDKDDFDRVQPQQRCPAVRAHFVLAFRRPRYASTTRGSVATVSKEPSAIFAPWSSAITRSEMPSTTCMSCSITRIV